MPGLVCAVAGPLRLAVPGRSASPSRGALAQPPRAPAPRSRGDRGGLGERGLAAGIRSVDAILAPGP
jgi:hypothetical protein